MALLNFKGKALVQSYHLVVPHHELKSVKAKSLTNKVSLHDNLVVHGDNLKALKALLPHYHGKVKCIYIDPPYNTGNVKKEGWKYCDNVNSPMHREWFGQVVSREDLTRHDKWLCMMWPRLRLLREFLTEDGVLLCSIDDNEAHHLRDAMDEIFGEENFIAQLVWEKGRKNDAKLFSVGHEYMLVYARSLARLKEVKAVWRETRPGAKELWEKYLELRKKHGDSHEAIEADLREWFKGLPEGNPAKALSRFKHIDKWGPWRDRDISWPGGGGPRYDVKHPETKRPCKVPERGWIYPTKAKMEQMIELGLVEFRPDDGEPPLRKAHLRPVPEELDEDDELPEPDDDSVEDGELGLQVMGSVLYKQSQVTIKLFRQLMGAVKFNNPKDHEILARMVNYVTSGDSNAIVLDAFAGSGTTAHSVLALNSADGGTRRFVLIESDDENIDALTCERVRRVIQGAPKAKDNTLRRGLGGSFSFFKVGDPTELESLLKGEKLPAFDSLASYVFYTATGEEFDERQIRRKTGFIGESAKYDVYLFYEPDLDYLKATALTLEMARNLPKGSGKKRLVFAPTKYLDGIHLEENRIEFCQLPFENLQGRQAQSGMKLKEYQEQSLREVKSFLEQLVLWRGKASANPEFEIDFPTKAWEKAEVGRPYLPRRDGLKRHLPAFCLKIPTGGGKTVLAVKTIDLVQSLYLQRQTGLVVWIVPTLQIYRQTLMALKDRDHPYRQNLDLLSAGRTLILEKSDGFAPDDIKERLCVLMLMLPSASRANKEALRMFRDSGAFQAFFPSEEEKDQHAELLRLVPNLETFASEDAFWGRIVKTSLGNTIRILEPLIILDEGHRAYSEQAQSTLRNLNPCMIVELSATPPKESNKLVVISGDELHKEEMIRLDLRVVNKSSTNWRDTMRAAMARRDDLEEKARAYEADTNVYIRPICLVQVERTGKEQRDGKFIHTEDVRDYLVGQGVPKDWIAVKSAEIDDIKDFKDAGGLLARDCPVRYIITKQALQEGWDCSFAYVLTILTNPRSKTALTQLVGRILRQPYARKTHVPALDESYVFCFQRTRLLDEIREGFKREGLEDMQGRVVRDENDLSTSELREVAPRELFKKAAANMVLPAFVIRDGGDWRLVSYEADILSRVLWTEADVSPLYDLELNLEEKRDVELRAGLRVDLSGFARRVAEEVRVEGWRFDYAYPAAHLLDVVPNPWIGYEFVELVFGKLLKKYKNREKVVANNLVFILEELRQRLEKERDRLAEATFNKMLAEDEMRFIVVAHDLGMHRLPKKVEMPNTAKRATRLDGSQFEMSLFDPVPEDDLNSLELEVASFLDEQDPLYFGTRNKPRRGYYVQGWQKSRIYADFIFTTHAVDRDEFQKVFVLETKGLHLKNDDTKYKKSVFDLCNARAKKKTWNEFVPAMQGKEISYEVVFQDEWKKRLNELLVED